MRVVAVFSGGGAKALAHAGAFRALEQAGLTPSHIVATSMGAVIGAALSAGLSLDAIRRRALGLTRKDVAPLDPFALIKGMFARSMIPAAALRKTIARIVPVSGWAGLKIPLTVTATDLDSGELLTFPIPDTRYPIPLLDALYATCALPLYFPPLEHDGRRLADGGLRAVLPLAVARQIPADLVVAVHVGSGFDEEPPPPSAAVRPLPALIRAHGEAIRIMMAAQVEREIAEWPQGGDPRLVVVRPVREREAMFAIERLADYVEAGFQATKKALA